MATRDEEIITRERANFAEFMEQGPGLRRSTRTWVIARGDGMVLLGGVGGLGHGRMWVRDSASYSHDATYAEAPYAPGTPDDFGDTGARRD